MVVNLGPADSLEKDRSLMGFNAASANLRSLLGKRLAPMNDTEVASNVKTDRNFKEHELHQTYTSGNNSDFLESKRRRLSCMNEMQSGLNTVMSSLAKPKSASGMESSTALPEICLTRGVSSTRDQAYKTSGDVSPISDPSHIKSFSQQMTITNETQQTQLML